MTQTNLPILYLRDVVLLPFNDIRLEFSNDIDKKILNIAESNYDGYVLLINLNDPLEEEPDYNTLLDIGILGKIKSKIDLPNGITRVVMTGIDRVEIVSINNNNDFLSAFVISTKEYDYNEVEASALRRVLYRKLDEYIDISPYMSNTVIGRITEVKNISKLSDIIVSELPLEYNEVLKYVSITNPMNRIREITLDLSKEIETVRLENEIEDNLKVKLEEEQKDENNNLKEENIESKIEKYKTIMQQLKKSLNTNGWDGRWFKRAFMDDGNTLGSMENDECRIDSIAQSWSTISNAGDNDKKYISMESLENHLIDRENGIIKLLLLLCYQIHLLLIKYCLQMQVFFLFLFVLVQ